MKILPTLDRCITKIDFDLIQHTTLYVEVSRENFDNLEKEYNTYCCNDYRTEFNYDRDVTIGDFKIFKYLGFTIIITINEDRTDSDIRISFITKII